MPDVDTAVRAMVKTSSVVEPASESRGVYDELFDVFTDVYESAAQAGIYRRIYDYQRAMS